MNMKMTSTDYMMAYLQEKKRSDELRKYLDEQIKNTTELAKENVRLLDKLRRYETNGLMSRPATKD